MRNSRKSRLNGRTWSVSLLDTMIERTPPCTHDEVDQVLGGGFFITQNTSRSGLTIPPRPYRKPKNAFTGTRKPCPHLGKRYQKVLNCMLLWVLSNDSDLKPLSSCCNKKRMPSVPYFSPALCFRTKENQAQELHQECRRVIAR